MNLKKKKLLFAALAAMVVCVSIVIGTSLSNEDKSILITEQANDKTNNSYQDYVIEDDDIYINEDAYVEEVQSDRENVISKVETISKPNAPIISTENKVENKDKIVTNKNENSSDHTSSGGNDSKNENVQKPQIDDTKVKENITGLVGENNKLTKSVEMESKEGVKATVPAGVKIAAGVKELQLSISEKTKSDSDVDVEATERLDAYDIHIEGIAVDNTVPVTIELGEVLTPGLNKGNLSLYHVEKNETVEMTEVASTEDFNAHNQFAYEPENGALAVAMMSFSEVAVVSEEPKWEGNFDYSWYTNAVASADGETATEFTIANADQLAGFGAIVGGMAKDDVGNVIQDTFNNETVKLIADINLGDAEAENNPDVIFYPIGYYNTKGSYERTTDSVTSSVSSFEGTFDGNGHTISNFYQNTWEMFGDYNDGYPKGSNYYKDAMGLFGYVVNGTVKNLTVNNFSSDGEFTPTGVIAAYAVNSTFENIAITNCNPRVYNTGNGGIVGIGGNSDDPDTYKLTFTNITIDNTNKITALWGSWDVACGGLVGMFRGVGHVYMTNCHVASQIDVYNDVCGNYQYYWYRYSGMMVGTNKNMITDANGYTVPETEKFHAEGCTVHFGDWNNYWYCELVANSLASYTHDHQFSRLTKVDSVDIENMTVTVDGETTAISTSGRQNYVVVEKNYSTENAKCFHFVNGAVWKHEDAGKETVNGVEVLKENNQHIYLPFNQLFTGYGWGVKHIPVYNGEDYAFEGITILDREEANSVVKFDKVDTVAGSYTTGTEVTIGDLFEAASIADPKLYIKSKNVQVTVSPADEKSTAGGIYVADTENWKNGTLTFSGKGTAKITITDYYFCKPTTIEVSVKGADIYQTIFKNTDKYIYRVGNGNEIALNSLFENTSQVKTEEMLAVSIKYLEGNVETFKDYTLSSSKISFKDKGIATITIESKTSEPATLTVEVIDAVNATSATSATANNVVLLEDCGFSSLEVSGGYTLYGNGFTMTCGSDSVAADFGYSFVTLNNGTLDNVQIVCPNFDYAALYKSNLTSGENRSSTDANGKTRYYNARSGVMVSGNSQILNSRILGGRASVNVSGGDLVIDNSRIELGAVASILVGSANSLTLRDTTLIQKPTASTYDSNKTLMGFSVLYLCDSEGKATPTTIEGSFVQQAWIDENDKQYVPSVAEALISNILGKTNYLHNINGTQSLNLGFAYMPEDTGKDVKKPDTNTLSDNRSDKETIPYDTVDVMMGTTTAYVYSYLNTNSTAESFITEENYVPNKYSDIITVTYSDTAEGLTTGKSYGTEGWVYELNVDLDKLSDYSFDFSKLSMNVNGEQITDFKVDGSVKPTSPVKVNAGGTTYTLTATIDGKEYVATYKVTGTETSKESPSLVASNYEAGLCVASSYGGTWHGAAPALEGIQIKYWSVAEKQYKTIKLSDYTPTTKGQLNGTNTTWTYSPANGDFTLTLTGGQVHSSNNVYAMPVVCENKLYFVAADSKGLVNSGNSARTIPVTYSFKDNNNGDVLTFSHTWSVAENKDAQYKYSDFCSGTLIKLEASGCVVPDTLITLADGTQKQVQYLSPGEELLVWNLETGTYDTAPIVFVDRDAETEYTVVNLHFSNGSKVGVIYEHGFFDMNLGKYVYITADNYNDYIGHKFVIMGDKGKNEWSVVTLDNVVVETKVTTAWSPVTFKHLCYYTDGVLSMPGGISGLFNIFEVDTKTMSYDLAKKEADIATHGLYTFEDFQGMIPEIAYEAFNGNYLKVAIAKGLLTWETIVEYAERYIPLVP